MPIEDMDHYMQIQILQSLLPETFYDLPGLEIYRKPVSPCLQMFRRRT